MYHVCVPQEVHKWNFFLTLCEFKSKKIMDSDIVWPPPQAPRSFLAIFKSWIGPGNEASTSTSICRSISAMTELVEPARPYDFSFFF